MTSPLRKRLQILLSLLSVLAALALIAAMAAYVLLRGSLPQLDGQRALAGLAAPVRIERDAHGVPRITGATRLDVARATGYLHGQERFFQMDLLRRRGAGELAEIFGAAAADLDRQARLHGFRANAGRVVASLSPAHRAVLDAYVSGVNAGLVGLARQPWEYYALRVAPAPWTAEDSVLCSYAMWFDLQDSRANFELSTRALKDAFGSAALAFFAPRGTEHDAALDGSLFPAPELPPLRLTPAEQTTVSAATPLDVETDFPGSNSFAVSGAHTATGAALLANDPHLGLSVPNTWYRAALEWRDANGATQTVVGGTLPGAPTVIIGSNQHVAWGFTNAYIDTVDVVVVETYVDLQYRTPTGWRDIEERTELIKVKGGEPVALITRWTEWGPLIGEMAKGYSYALRWTAHDPAATNLGILDFETARSVSDVLRLAPAVGMPNNNLLVADTAGAIAWTVIGVVPRREGFDGRLPSSWAYGDRRWAGWLPAAEVPAVVNPADGLLWTANNRIVGGADYEKLGDGGYDKGFRGGAIRDDLRALASKGRKITEADLLGVQLDDRGRFLDRWRELLLRVLSDEAVAKKKKRGELRALAESWHGHAAVDSAGYRIIRTFRLRVAERTLAPFAARPQNRFERFSFARFMTEDAVWRLVNEQPTRLLNPEHRTWDSLLLAAADDVLAEAEKSNVPLAHFTWGARNTLRMQHPISRFVPRWIGSWFDMPADPLPGDSNVPRVQSPTFGASHRFVVTPGREADGIFQMPGGQSGHPLSAHYRAGHAAWIKGERSPILPGPAAHTLTLTPGN